MKNKLIYALILIFILLNVNASFIHAKEISKDLVKEEYIHYIDSVQISDRPAQSPKDRCYRLVDKRWFSLPIQFTLDFSSINKTDLSLIEKSVSKAAEIWNSASSRKLFNDVLIIGNNLSYGKNDGINSISFGKLKNKKEIAKTTFWYSRKTKEIIDADIKFNAYYFWGDAKNNSQVMDVQDIAAHELGHVLGLKDIYLRYCQDVTMFGYSNIGEIKKQTLESSDITAIKRLYG